MVGEAEALNTPQKLQMTKAPYKDKRNLVTDIYRRFESTGRRFIVYQG